MNLQKSPDNNDELPGTPPRQVTDNQATATKNSNIFNPMTTSCGTDADCQIEDDQWDVGEAEGVTVADPLLGEAKPSCVYSILKPHDQSFRRPVRPLLSKAKPSYVYSILKPPGHSSRSWSDRC